MQAFKLALLGALLFVLVRSVPVFYHSSEFNSFVEQQASGIHSKGILKELILRNAVKNRIPVTAQNINFTTNDSTLQVSVEYQIPLDLYFYQRDLSFHAAGSGLFVEN